jgi:hypothetical protein
VLLTLSVKDLSLFAGGGGSRFFICLFMGFLRGGTRFFCLFLGGGTRVGTWGFGLANQALLPLDLYLQSTLF